MKRTRLPLVLPATPPPLDAIFFRAQVDTLATHQSYYRWGKSAITVNNTGVLAQDLCPKGFNVPKGEFIREKQFVAPRNHAIYQVFGMHLSPEDIAKNGYCYSFTFSFNDTAYHAWERTLWLGSHGEGNTGNDTKSHLRISAPHLESPVLVNYLSQRENIELALPFSFKDLYHGGRLIFKHIAINVLPTEGGRCVFQGYVNGKFIGESPSAPAFNDGISYWGTVGNRNIDRLKIAFGQVTLFKKALTPQAIAGEFDYWNKRSPQAFIIK